MGKLFLRFLLIIFLLSTILAIFLTYFGLETSRFDNLIKNKANEINRNLKLEFNKTKIYLEPEKLNLAVKLKTPRVLIKNNDIELSKLNLYLSLKSFFSSDFLLKRAEVGFVENDIKDITKITNAFLPRIINKKLKKVFEKGNLEGELTIPFGPDGRIEKDYGFFGKISNAKINLNKKFSVKNLTTEISRKEGAKDKKINILIKKGLFFDLDLSGSTMELKNNNDSKKIDILLRTNGKINFSQVEKISSIFNFNTNFLKDLNGETNLKTNLVFELNKKFKIKNLSYTLIGDLPYFELLTEEKKIIKEFFPDYDPLIILKSTNIKFTSSDSYHTATLNGLIKVNDKYDNFELKEKYTYDKKTYDIKGNLDLTNSQVEVSRLNYNKKDGKKSQLNFDISFILNKSYNIRSLDFIADKTKINLNNIKLNRYFEAVDFKNLKIKTFSNGINNNDFVINKSKNVTISGKVFDAKPILKSLYKKDTKKTFSKDFNSGIKINFEKALTGTNDNVSNLSMIATIRKGSYDKLSLKGNFSKNEIVEVSIYQTDEGKKTLQVISDRARPFVKNYDFIKGFEGGKLEYESIIFKKISNSNLKISNFKVSKVPALAKLLTLASLQGIADTLSGEGIRFETFEMKSNSEGNVLNIEEALAMGPAVSILLEGYVDKGNLVSLRGTLVPATKLNSIIASIPLVGDILVGKKTGEGVVGVSFKMKGPPKDIKTTVNPIKTLTPRFIVRAVEKMKKKKK